MLPLPTPPEPPAVEGDFTEQLGNGVDLEMVKIPGDTFLMGSPSNEKDRYSNESPQHLVTVSEFWIGKYSVTQAQWGLVAVLPKVRIDLDPDPSRFKGERLPVERVYWYEAVEFCQRLSRKTGRPYRLHSEAEWEYACRAGTATTYCFGDSISSNQVSFSVLTQVFEEFQGTRIEEDYLVTKPVGSYPSNAFGLYDMHGNVWEWCADHWHSNYEGAPVDGSAWLSNNEGANRLLRGGSCVSNPRFCRSASRTFDAPTFRNSLNGFRVSFSAVGCGI